MSLFGPSHVPLAERMRPQTLEEFVGQEHLVGEDGVIRRVLASGQMPSMILWGPPGVGKTTLAGLITRSLDRPFFTLSAVSSGVKEVREVIKKAEVRGDAVLFIDEIHRFNKAQQDSLLGAVERGTIKLIGATTENPSFEVISALLSRCQVYILKSLEQEHLQHLVDETMKRDEWLCSRDLKLKETAALFRLSGGDARKLLSVLEITAQSLPVGGEIDDQSVQQFVQKNIALYDKGGEQHYDVVSAFIKSVRGNDPNAAVYWLARMVEGGEDPKFIARRMVILASEDIGNANPTALVLATNCFQAVTMIGYPECRIILSQCATYLASSPKSNAAYMAIGKAQGAVREHGDLSVPLHLRNAPTGLMKNMDYGKNYVYSHDDPSNQADQEFLPDELSGTVFYKPGDNAREREMRKRLSALWSKRYGY